MLLTPILFAFTVFVADWTDHHALLRKARNQMQNSAVISYHHEILWPNPADKVDTLMATSTLRKNANQYFTHDYVVRSNSSDFIYIDNRYQMISHGDSTVFLYSEDDMNTHKRMIIGNIYVSNSPLTLASDSAWRHFGDTAINKTLYTTYRRVEMDTIINGNKIFVEEHLFIESIKAFVERYERRAFFNGRPSQTIIHSFTHYDLENKDRSLTYRLPTGYKSTSFGEREQLSTLKEGQHAPEFRLADIDGNVIDLKSLRGRKVLLNFSVINCGYCKLALEHLTGEGYDLPDNVLVIYINPEDDKTELADYRRKIPIPFPAIAAAKALGKSYGVSAFPTFFLIDEHGKIERTVVGYRGEFLQSLAK